MKKRFILIFAVMGLSVSCPSPDGNNPDNPPVEPEQKTMVLFDNAKGISSVSVYDDYRRRDEDKIADISAGQLCRTEYTPGDSVPFFFSYAINLKGVSGFTVNYVPKEIEKNQITVRVDAGKTNPIIVPKLEDTVSSPDELLSKDSYLLIQNNSSFP